MEDKDTNVILQTEGDVKPSEEGPVYGDKDFLYNADPNCKHDIETLWSGVKCRKCPGWFCY